jgi:hypothetical protein
VISDNEARDKLLIDLCVLADKLMDPTTTNMAIDKLMHMTEALALCPSCDLVTNAYKLTLAGSPLRRLFFLETITSTLCRSRSVRPFTS